VLLSVIVLSIPLFLYLFLPLRRREDLIVTDRELLTGKERFLRKQQSEQGDRSERPNIVLIVADDLGKTDISLHGNTNLDTPNIDSIGRSGVIFENAYCTSPICSPSRAGLLTGRYQQRFGYELQSQSRYPRNRLEYFIAKNVVDMGDWVLNGSTSFPSKEDHARQGIPRSEITLGELLQAGGYATAAIGKWHLGYSGEYLPHNRGFDFHYGFYEAFSLYAPTDDPDIINFRHSYYKNKWTWKKGRKGTCAIRRNGTIVKEERYLTTAIGEEGADFIESRRGEQDPFFLYLPFSAPHTPFQTTREYYDRFSHIEDQNLRVYCGMIAALDEAVGKILDTLKQEGLEENTLVIFASDNGGATYTEATDNGPLEGGKMTNFEGGLNVPLMMRLPGRISPGTRYGPDVSLVDIVPTVAAAAHIPLPEDRQYDGTDLLPFVNGNRKGKPHNALFWRSDYTGVVIKDGWKLIRDEKRDRSHLFKLIEDKTESTDLHGSYPEKTGELLRLFREWSNGLRPPRWRSFIEFRYRAADGTYHYFPI
jgi:arylsulfatase A-like enzyme